MKDTWYNSVQLCEAPKQTNLNKKRQLHDMMIKWDSEIFNLSGKRHKKINLWFPFLNLFPIERRWKNVSVGKSNVFNSFKHAFISKFYLILSMYLISLRKTWDLNGNPLRRREWKENSSNYNKENRGNTPVGLTMTHRE